MSFLRKTSLGSGRHFRPGPKRLFGIVAAFLFVVALSATFSKTPFKDFLTLLARPFWYVQEYVMGTADSALTNMRSKTDLLNENAQLNQKVQEQAEAILLNRTLQAENDELKTAFGRDNQRDVLLVATLSAPGVSAYDTVIIDAGVDLGVKRNALVYFSSTTAAGYISEVYLSTALVQLYSHPNEEVTVYTGEKRFFTKATGQGGGNFIVKLPHESGVKEGDLIMVPGTPALVLGLVGTIETDVAKSLQIARVRSPYNASQTHFLYVQREK
ncbi:MAG: rod shape-determining protein MreC [Patescibacteria group bacterium]